MPTPPPPRSGPDQQGHAMTALGAIAATLVVMELYSALAHRLLWHGPLWKLHKSHHAGLEGAQHLVRNDLLSLAHAPIAAALIAATFFVPASARQLTLGAGAGMAIFGALYFVFHDGMVHGRLASTSRLLRFRACRAWKTAHLAHHRRPGGPFGFFASPLVMLLASIVRRRSCRCHRQCRVDRGAAPP